MKNFIHLHVHSEYSLLDGANRIKELPKRVKELGMNSVAITDHGVMYGVIEFYKACKKEGVKPIIGCEVYVAPRSRFDKEANIDNKYNHLILLAKNNNGYKNLTKLVSLGFTEGYYYKPRIDLELLEKYHEDLICMSACLAGSIPQEILKNNIAKSIELVKYYKKLFGEDFYLEIQHNELKEQQIVNQKMIELSRELKVPLVATNDAHYLNKDDAYAHEILLCIQTGKRMSDLDRMKFETDELYIKSPEEMYNNFKNIPEALENTLKIADKCNVEFEFGVTKLPNYEVPEEYKTHYDYFAKLCYEGLEKRYGIVRDCQKISTPLASLPTPLARLEYELSVIEKMGYVDYFLIVWDFINYAKSIEIPVGPGRGSGAGSIAAYVLGITDIDPIKYNLIFERFLNPERISMPDFDIDFCYERRQEIIDYVARKYGQEHVAQIITFGTMSARMVIRDVGRVLDIPYAETDKLAKMVPMELHITIKEALEVNQELKFLYDTDEKIKNLLDIAIRLEGLPRHASTHAAGVVITKDPVVSYVPLYVNENQVSTQYTMTILEELGLLKMDFLGLRTLTVIDDAIKLVKKNRGVDVEFDENYDDKNVFKLWQEGQTIGIFQFESAGMISFMKELKPNSLEDIIAGVSLYRPGPMDQIPRYIKNKNNPEHIEYTHKALENILKVTYGCMVYQEQVMQIVRDLAGYSLGRADLVRRAMGKKKLDVMAKEREYFIYGQTDENGNILVNGCIRNGIDEESANKIFDEMAEFAKYAFNKSHAAAYSVVAYKTAYLKTYYPAEFMAAMLNSFLGNLDKIPMYVDECKRLKVDILKPDINKSFTKFTVENGKICFGLGSVKNVGVKALEPIILEREKNGKFKSFEDFLERTQGEGINKKCIESLIKTGVFDNLGKTRATLLASYEKILDTINDTSRKNMKGQVTLFDLGNLSGETSKQLEENKYQYEEKEELAKRELLNQEKEMTGIYISGHPLDSYRKIIEEQATLTANDIKEFIETNNQNKNKIEEGNKVRLVGIINHIKKLYTKRNTEMAFISVEDLYGNIELVVFDKIFSKIKGTIKESDVVVIDGKISIKDDEYVNIIVDNMYKIEADKYFGKTLEVDITNLTREQKDKLKVLIRTFNNKKNNVNIQVNDNGKIIPCGKMFINDEVLGKIEILGMTCIVSEK